MTYSLSDIVNMIIGAVKDILGSIAAKISENTDLIAEAVVLGALTYGVVRYGSNVFRSITGMLSGFF